MLVGGSLALTAVLAVRWRSPRCRRVAGAPSPTWRRRAPCRHRLQSRSAAPAPSWLRTGGVSAKRAHQRQAGSERAASAPSVPTSAELAPSVPTSAELAPSVPTSAELALGVRRQRRAGSGRAAPARLPGPASTRRDHSSRDRRADKFPLAVHAGRRQRHSPGCRGPSPRRGGHRGWVVVGGRWRLGGATMSRFR